MTDTGDRPESTKAMKKRVNRGLAWIGVASSMVGILDMLALVILISFWISAEQVGIAMLAVPTFKVLDLVTDLGLTAAVIQRDDHTEEKISTLFWLNMAMSVVVTLILVFGVGPILAALQGHEILAWLISAYGAKLLWQNVYFIPYALMKRELRFKELSLLRIIANFAEFGGKIGFAWAGFGVWCFVLGPLCRVLVTGVGTQILHPWRPRLVLRVREALDWVTYGIKTSASKILFHTYTNVDYQVVAYFFGATANGFYAAAYTLVLEPALVISEIVVNVAFPAFSRLKHDRQALIDQLIAFTRMNLVIMLAFIGVVVVSTYDIFYLLEMVKGENWSAAAPAARILCAVAVLRALSFVIPPLLDGINRPTLTLRYMAIAAVVLPTTFVLFAVLLGDWMGYLSVALAWAIGYPIAFAALLLIVLSVLEMKLWEFLSRVYDIILCAAAAIGASFAVAVALQSAPGPVRFGVATAVMLLGFFGLLSRFAGISPRSVARSLRE